MLAVYELAARGWQGPASVTAFAHRLRHQPSTSRRCTCQTRLSTGAILVSLQAACHFGADLFFLHRLFVAHAKDMACTALLTP